MNKTRLIIKMMMSETDISGSLYKMVQPAAAIIPVTAAVMPLKHALTTGDAMIGSINFAHNNITQAAGKYIAMVEVSAPAMPSSL